MATFTRLTRLLAALLVVVVVAVVLATAGSVDGARDGPMYYDRPFYGGGDYPYTRHRPVCPYKFPPGSRFPNPCVIPYHKPTLPSPPPPSPPSPPPQNGDIPPP
ncbi:hypothetical protein ABZP36_021818 [Zizania latifolia]